MTYKIHVTNQNGTKGSLDVPTEFTFDEVCEVANRQANKFSAKAEITCDGELLFGCDYRTDEVTVQTIINNL